MTSHLESKTIGPIGDNEVFGMCKGMSVYIASPRLRAKGHGEGVTEAFESDEATEPLEPLGRGIFRDRCS